MAEDVRHAHHDRSWSHGGRTDPANARNLCPHHHARTHDPAYDPAYETRRQASGAVTFHRRTSPHRPPQVPTRLDQR